ELLGRDREIDRLQQGVRAGARLAVRRVRPVAEGEVPDVFRHAGSNAGRGPRIPPLARGGMVGSVPATPYPRRMTSRRSRIATATIAGLAAAALLGACAAPGST